MGLRLFILSWWTPNYIIRRELENISELTTSALEKLVSKYDIEEVDLANQERLRSLSIPKLRAAMARTHAELVETLEAKVGHEEAVKRGREVLFLVGQEVGRKARKQLGVSDSPKDLTRAAKILYRVLGINFRLQWLCDSHAKVVIDRCALARHYSKLTCEVLSATDEGVMRGLQPHVTMSFREYMPSGCKNCIADIHFGGKEAD